ncbi:hypothetical protein B0H13DRAFT_2323723 [Mycena leptocephala]|nr:hypothetical protein B0H13DRAFT_2323723 [Mycena leptocephala]
MERHGKDDQRNDVPASPFFLVLTLLVWYPSIVVQARPSSLRENARILGKRDAFSDSGLSSASWIWLAEPDLLTTAPTGNVAFLKTFATPTGKTAASAQIAMTVDNNFTLWVNGQPVAASDPEGEDGWQTAQVLSAALNASANVISVLAANANPVSPGQQIPLAFLRLFAFSSPTAQMRPSYPTIHGWFLERFPRISPSPSTSRRSDQPKSLPSMGQDLGERASWIWNITDASGDAPAETVGFRKTVVAPSDKTASSATVLLSADNSFDLYVNGHWEYAQRFTVTLTPSTNVFTVFATNFPSQQTTGAGSSAGFIAALQIKYTDGSSDIVRTDTTWLDGPFHVGILVPCHVRLQPWPFLGTTPPLPRSDDNYNYSPTSRIHEQSAHTNPLHTIKPPSPSPSPTTSGAQATINGRASLPLLFALPIIAFSYSDLRSCFLLGIFSISALCT